MLKPFLAVAKNDTTTANVDRSIRSANTSKGCGMKLFLLICLAAAASAIAFVSLVGVDRVPNWFLPSMVFGVPFLAIVSVLLLGSRKRRKDQKERERKVFLDTGRNSFKED